MHLRVTLPLLAGLAWMVLSGSPITTWWMVALPYLAYGLARVVVEVGDGEQAARLGEQGTEGADT